MSNDSQGASANQHKISPDTGDNRRLWLEEWKLRVQGSRDSARQMRSDAYSYAQISLNSAFLINAGALVAIPPLMQWLLPEQRQHISSCAGYFLVGLLLAAACSMVTFANLTLGGRVLDANANTNAALLAVRYKLQDESVLREKDYIRSSTARKRLMPWIGFTFSLGIGCGIASYAAFLMGVYAFIRIVKP
jgi:hypothetical protein